MIWPYQTPQRQDYHSLEETFGSERIMALYGYRGNNYFSTSVAQ